MVIVVMLASFVLAATATPLAGLHYLDGTWNCTHCRYLHAPRALATYVSLILKG